MTGMHIHICTHVSRAEGEYIERTYENTRLFNICVFCLWRAVNDETEKEKHVRCRIHDWHAYPHSVQMSAHEEHPKYMRTLGYSPSVCSVSGVR